MIATYQPSGRFAMLGLLLAPLAALASGVGLAYVYQLLIEAIPFIYANVLLALAFGALVGLAVGIALRVAKCRNMVIVTFMAVLGGAVGIGAGHQFAYLNAKPEFDKTTPQEETGAQAESPTFEEYLAFRVETGWTTGKSGSSTRTEISGAAVYAIWAVEALMVCGMAVFLARLMCNDPFCEKCELWTKPEDLGVARGVDAARLENAVATGDLVGVLSPTPQPQSVHSVRYTLARCPGCASTLFVGARLEWEVAKGKKSEAKHKELLRHAVITPEQAEALAKAIARPGSVVVPPSRPTLPGPGELKPVKKPLPGKRV